MRERLAPPCFHTNERYPPELHLHLLKWLNLQYDRHPFLIGFLFSARLQIGDLHKRSAPADGYSSLQFCSRSPRWPAGVLPEMHVNRKAISGFQSVSTGVPTSQSLESLSHSTNTHTQRRRRSVWLHTLWGNDSWALWPEELNAAVYWDESGPFLEWLHTRPSFHNEPRHPFQTVDWSHTSHNLEEDASCGESPIQFQPQGQPPCHSSI